MSLGRLQQAIDSGTLTRWILDLANAPDASGIFHLGASDALSRYEMMRELAVRMGYPSDLAAASSSAPHRAPRGRRHMLVPARIHRYSSVSIPTSIQTIERCMNACF